MSQLNGSQYLESEAPYKNLGSGSKALFDAKAAKGTYLAHSGPLSLIKHTFNRLLVQ